MGETKDDKKIKKGKHKAKPTIGDIIFRILIITAIFFISVIFYVFYIRNMSSELRSNGNEITTQIKKY